MLVAIFANMVSRHQQIFSLLKENTHLITESINTNGQIIKTTIYHLQLDTPEQKLAVCRLIQDIPISSLDTKDEEKCVIRFPITEETEEDFYRVLEKYGILHS